MIARRQRRGVELEGCVAIRSAKLGVQLSERRREPFEVLRRALITHVGVVRDGRRTVQPRPEAADHDEPHVVSLEGPERAERVERR